MAVTPEPGRRDEAKTQISHPDVRPGQLGRGPPVIKCFSTLLSGS